MKYLPLSASPRVLTAPSARAKDRTSKQKSCDGDRQLRNKTSPKKATKQWTTIHTQAPTVRYQTPKPGSGRNKHHSKAHYKTVDKRKAARHAKRSSRQQRRNPRPPTNGVRFGEADHPGPKNCTVTECSGDHDCKLVCHFHQKKKKQLSGYHKRQAEKKAKSAPRKRKDPVWLPCKTSLSADSCGVMRAHGHCSCPRVHDDFKSMLDAYVQGVVSGADLLGPLPSPGPVPQPDPTPAPAQLPPGVAAPPPDLLSVMDYDEYKDLMVYDSDDQPPSSSCSRRDLPPPGATKALVGGTSSSPDPVPQLAPMAPSDCSIVIDDNDVVHIHPQFLEPELDNSTELFYPDDAGYYGGLDDTEPDFHPDQLPEDFKWDREPDDDSDADEEPTVVNLFDGLSDDDTKAEDPSSDDPPADDPMDLDDDVISQSIDDWLDIVNDPADADSDSELNRPNGQVPSTDPTTDEEESNDSEAISTDDETDEEEEVEEEDEEAKEDKDPRSATAQVKIFRKGTATHKSLFKRAVNGVISGATRLPFVKAGETIAGNVHDPAENIVESVYITQATVKSARWFWRPEWSSGLTTYQATGQVALFHKMYDSYHMATVYPFLATQALKSSQLNRMNVICGDAMSKTCIPGVTDWVYRYRDKNPGIFENVSAINSTIHFVVNQLTLEGLHRLALSKVGSIPDFRSRARLRAKRPTAART